MRGELADAKVQVRAPAVLLLLLGVASSLVMLALIGLALSKPAALADLYERYFIDTQPPGVLKENLTEMFAKQRPMMLLNTPLNLGYWTLLLAANLGMVVGAVRMMQLRSYRWAMAACVCAFLPLNGFGCLLLPMVFGIYAIVVLSRADVLEAFRTVAHLPGVPHAE